MRSFLYPNNYMVTNTTAVQKKDLATQVFWDKNPAITVDLLTLKIRKYENAKI